MNKDFLIYHTAYGKDSLKVIVEDILKYKPKDIFYFTIGEWDLPQTIPDDDFKLLEKTCIENNVQFYVLLGGMEHAYYVSHRYPKQNFNILRWPTYCLHDVYYSLTHHNYDHIETLNAGTNFEYLYDLYNNIPHYHRCVLIDEFAKYDLIKDGIISWNQIDPKYSNYEFKHWEPKLVILDDDFMLDDKRNEYTKNLLKNSGFCSIVTESTTNHIDYTEKTYRTIMLEKPYIGLGKAKHNKWFTKLGFELYDEIFDYSLDHSPVLERRVESIVNSVKRLRDKDIHELYNLVQPKIKRNKKRAMDLIKKDEFIPRKLVEFYNNHIDVFHDAVDGINIPQYFIDVINKNQ
jgi:hypothetical protein